MVFMPRIEAFQPQKLPSLFFFGFLNGKKTLLRHFLYLKAQFHAGIKSFVRNEIKYFKK
jgi:hypothetical protein